MEAQFLAFFPLAFAPSFLFFAELYISHLPPHQMFFSFFLRNPSTRPLFPPIRARALRDFSPTCTPTFPFPQALPISVPLPFPSSRPPKSFVLPPHFRNWSFFVSQNPHFFCSVYPLSVPLFCTFFFPVPMAPKMIPFRAAIAPFFCIYWWFIRGEGDFRFCPSLAASPLLFFGFSQGGFLAPPGPPRRLVGSPVFSSLGIRFFQNPSSGSFPPF